MKATKKLWIAQGKRHSDSIFLYDKELTAGAKGVYTGDIDKIEHYPPSSCMRELNERDLDILGVSIKPGQSIEIEISYDKPREIGWYPVILRDKVSLREADITAPKQRKEGILWWNGGSFVDDAPGGSRVYGEHQLSWIADEPIPDPFERIP